MGGGGWAGSRGGLGICGRRCSLRCSVCGADPSLAIVTLSCVAVPSVRPLQPVLQVEPGRPPARHGGVSGWEEGGLCL